MVIPTQYWPPLEETMTHKDFVEKAEQLKKDVYELEQEMKQKTAALKTEREARQRLQIQEENEYVFDLVDRVSTFVLHPFSWHTVRSVAAIFSLTLLASLYSLNLTCFALSSLVWIPFVPYLPPFPDYRCKCQRPQPPVKN